MIHEEPKILVGIITYDGHCYCQDLVLYNIRTQNYRNFKLVVFDTSKTNENYEYLKSHGYDVRKIEWVEGSIQRIVNFYNEMRKLAIEGNYDYMLTVAADWIMPQHAIATMVSHRKDCVGPLCIIKGKWGPPCVLKSGWMNKQAGMFSLDTYTWEEIMELRPRLIRCHGAPIGLVSRKVFEKIPFRNVSGVGEDILFWQECADHGFEWYCDTAIHVRHFQKPWNGNRLWKEKQKSKKEKEQ